MGRADIFREALRLEAEVKRLKKALHEARCLLKEVEVQYVNKRVAMPQDLHAKIVNFLGPNPATPNPPV